MSYYDNQRWSTSNSHGWEQQTPPTRSGTSSVVQREDLNAFATQIEEVDRAIDNLMKSGKMFPAPGRRESMPVVGGIPRQFADHSYDPRLCAAPPRHHSMSDFADARSYSATNLQSYYANQRHYPSRGTNEAEQVMQAKRRMAAQRERELRNYHQEQQYNRSVTAEITSLGGKPDRSLSNTNGIKEEERRDIVARQRNALYNEGVSYPGDGVFDENGNKAHTQPVNAIRGHSPRSFEPFNASSLGENNATHVDSQYSSGQVPAQEVTHPNSISSPSSNPSNGYNLFEQTSQQSNCTSSSPGESPPHQGSKSTSSNVAPIGTRPGGQAIKRAMTPLPSPLSYAFAANEKTHVKAEKPINKNEKTQIKVEKHASSSVHTQNGKPEQDLGIGWAKGTWSNKSNLGVQAPVWG
ncbi:hypothetical protein HI914_00777 [Erysiphe necator]|nr:hypothetical protein HI914_00777 [Erysiphe necator]